MILSQFWKTFFARKQDSMYLEELQEIWDVDFQLPHPQLKWLVQI